MNIAWAHLPNAAHIDRVIASAHVDVSAWNEAIMQNAKLDIDNAWCDNNYDAWKKGRAIVKEKLGEDEFTKLLTLDRDLDKRHTLGDAIIALVAYDDCAYMLDSDPDELKIIAKFGNGVANLLWPACLALSIK